MNGVYWALLICSEGENRWNYKAMFSAQSSQKQLFFFLGGGFCMLSKYMIQNILNNNHTPLSVNGKLKLIITCPEPPRQSAELFSPGRRKDQPDLPQKTCPCCHMTVEGHFNPRVDENHLYLDIPEQR